MAEKESLLREAAKAREAEQRQIDQLESEYGKMATELTGLLEESAAVRVRALSRRAAGRDTQTHSAPHHDINTNMPVTYR